MRFLGFLTAAALLGCAANGTKINREEGADLSRYNHIGVPAFVDAKGRGADISESLEKGLQGLMHQGVDRKALDELLKKYKPDQENGLGTEAMMSIRSQTGADAVIFGRMAAEWTAAIVFVVDTAMGGTEMTGVVKPSSGKKAFSSPEEVAKDVLDALMLH